MGALMLIVVPLVIYLSLAIVAPGRPAAIALLVALVLAGVTALVQPGAGGLVQLALGGIGLAAFAQGFRWLLGPRLTQPLYLMLLGLPPLAVVLIFSLGFGA